MALDFNFEFLSAATIYYGAATAYSGGATAYAAQPQLILWTKPIVMSNPTQVEGSVEFGVELGLWQYRHICENVSVGQYDFSAPLAWGISRSIQKQAETKLCQAHTILFLYKNMRLGMSKKRNFLRTLTRLKILGKYEIRNYWVSMTSSLEHSQGGYILKRVNSDIFSNFWGVARQFYQKLRTIKRTFSLQITRN